LITGICIFIATLPTGSQGRSLGGLKNSNNMKQQTKSIRPFIGAKDFELSRNFYTDLGFKETILSNNMSVFKIDELAFYLQDAYVQDWIDNSMIFLEVENIALYWDNLLALNLTAKYKNVKIVPIKSYNWGKECFIHDPSGVLWHIGEFIL
jgi:hypothetical protein